MNTFWRKYTSTLFLSYGNQPENRSELDLRKDSIFKYVLSILLPLSTIAFVPGIIYSFHVNLPILGIVDIISLCALIILTLPFKIPLHIRKIIFVSIAYFISVSAIWFVGMLGPGLILLLAAGLFGVVFFPTKFSIYFAHLNLVIIVLFGILITQHVFDWPILINRDHIIEEWGAVTGNLILMSYLFALLIPYLFKKLQNTIDEQHKLKLKLEIKKSQLENAYEQLKRQNTELENFAYVASHDLQEPLRMVSSFMEKIENKYSDVLDEKGKTYLHFAVDGSKRMRRMIIDLLEYSRFQRTKEASELVNLNAIIEEELTVFKEKLNEIGAQINVRPLPEYFASKSAFVRLFQNLISNSIKYHRLNEKLTIDISYTETEANYVISFKDNGIGIDEKYQSKVFTLFQRLHREEEIPGSGLGLAICKKVVNDIGGEIWFESAELHGTNFLFTLPKPKI